MDFAERRLRNGHGELGESPDQYVFRLVFDLPANAILDTATFRYQIATGIHLHSVWLHGHRIQSSPAGGYGSFTGPIPVGPSSGLFFATNNSLDGIVVNAGNPGTPDPATGNAMGLRFGILESNVDVVEPPPGNIPEPGTMLLMAAELGAIGLIRFRFRAG